MNLTILFILILLCSFTGLNLENQTVKSPEITCDENGCYGTYSGPEFIGRSDVAHQFSNHMSNKVGDQLKTLFDDGKYVTVDLKNIKMITQDMDGKGDVIYSLEIPFTNVTNACEAHTAFDHRGGWGHLITQESVLQSFEKKDNLETIELLTPEGLQEFWIQWRHESRQAYCK